MNYQREITQILFHLDCEVTVLASHNYSVVSTRFEAPLTLDDRNKIKQRITQEFPQAVNFKWLEMITKVYEIDNGPPAFRKEATQYAFTFEVSHETA